MKNVLFVIILISTLSMPSFAINFGSYRAETDYGLIDGFKWNFFNRKEGQPLVEIKSETKEEQIRIEKAKNQPKEEQDDVQLFRFMTDDVVAF